MTYDDFRHGELQGWDARAEFDRDTLALLAGDEFRAPMPSIAVSGPKPEPVR